MGCRRMTIFKQNGRNEIITIYEETGQAIRITRETKTRLKDFQPSSVMWDGLMAISSYRSGLQRGSYLNVFNFDIYNSKICDHRWTIRAK